MSIESEMRQVDRTLPGDDPDTAQVREQLAQEMEQQLVAQEHVLEHGTGVPIGEQHDVVEDGDRADGMDVIALEGDPVRASSGAETDHGEDRNAWVDPGSGTDEDQSSIELLDALDPNANVADVAAGSRMDNRPDDQIVSNPSNRNDMDQEMEREGIAP